MTKDNGEDLIMSWADANQEYLEQVIKPLVDRQAEIEAMESVLKVHEGRYAESVKSAAPVEAELNKLLEKVQVQFGKFEALNVTVDLKKSELQDIRADAAVLSDQIRTTRDTIQRMKNGR